MIKEGDKAPAFALESDAGKMVKLSDFAGKTLVLYFYPKDDTPGCTRQAQAFTAASRAFVEAGAAVVGVSRDSRASHCKFRDKYGLSIPLLSDPERVAHEAYGAWGEKTMYGKKVTGAIRTTFVIRDGRVARIFRNVKVDGHADAVLAALGGASQQGDADEPAPKGGAAAKKRTSVAAATPGKSKTKTGAKAKSSRV